MNILLLNNNFLGSYSSNQVYYKEIEMELILMGFNVFLVNTVEMAIEVLREFTIDFSLCLGVYEYEIEGVKLYDYYKIPHYQWISDNPYKFNIDTNSEFIKYIFIDYEFVKMAIGVKNYPLILPLGCTQKEKRSDFNKKINGILFPGQVRNIDSINMEIENSEFRESIKEFIDKYDLDTSFIDTFITFASSRGLLFNKEFFRLCNSYIRAYKRITVLNAIKDIPVYIAGKKQYDGLINNQYFLGEKSFSEIEEIMSNYRYILNVDPNYHECIHDRVSRGINAGSIVISNLSNSLCLQKGYVNTYSFRDINNINKLLHYNESECEVVYSNQLKFIKKSYWNVSLKTIIDDYSNWRINNGIKEIGK